MDDIEIPLPFERLIRQIEDSVATLEDLIVETAWQANQRPLNEDAKTKLSQIYDTLQTQRLQFRDLYFEFLDLATEHGYLDHESPPNTPYIDMEEMLDSVDEIVSEALQITL